MDLKQLKPTKSEWESIEVPVSSLEKDVLDMIQKGYADVNIKLNNHESVLSFLKMKYSEKMEDYIYVTYLKPLVDVLLKTYEITIDFQLNIANVKINSEDKIRLRNNTLDTLKKTGMYEHILIQHVDGILSSFKKTNVNVKTVKTNVKTSVNLKNDFYMHYYTLHNLLKNSISKLNRHILQFCKHVLRTYEDKITKMSFIEHSVEILERNKSLLKYQDMTLYDHQKEIFTICKTNTGAKLILYMAPTGTGKTMTPIGLSEAHRIIFVCAARHVGLALARAAVSVNKKIAFAFGCSCAQDIRLHYFAAKDYTINKRTGGIKKVDNSNGVNVEIMICDISSYVPAMLYMCAFNSPENIILYWDEPTMTLDYEEHELHQVIRNNWKQNMIPTVILSSATLPKEHEICHCISDFRARFEYAEVFSINTYDCKKSITIIDKNGYSVLPHFLSANHIEVQKMVKHCEDNLTLLRYFDLEEVVAFIRTVVQRHISAEDERLSAEMYFEGLEDINMKNIKLYYLKLLKFVSNNGEKWELVYAEIMSSRKPRLLENEPFASQTISKMHSVGPMNPLSNSSTNLLNGLPITKLKSTNDIDQTTKEKDLKKGSSGIYVTTKDAYSLTDGPTIFICDDIEKVAKFCVQQAKIPSLVMSDLMEKINYNNAINERLGSLEKELEFLKEQQDSKVASSAASTKVTKQMENAEEGHGRISKITYEIEQLTSLTKSIQLNDTFVPNKRNHIQKWASRVDASKSFTSDVEEGYVNEIMLLDGVEDDWKILLMMGIGVYVLHENVKYTEIMKKLASEQKLFMILASSDYIYGTNYQFCHGYLSKGLNLTQEKIIQSFGRVGRGNIQQTYTIRLRDDDIIKTLFTKEAVKREAVKMNLLLSCLI